MSRHTTRVRCGFQVVVALALVALGSHAARAISIGQVNFAASANGGMAISNGSNPLNAIDGTIALPGGTANSTSWPGGGAIGTASWTGTLAAEAPVSTISEIRVYDRGCCTSVAPYSIELLDASNAVIYMGSNPTASPQLRPATFAVPNITGATKVRFLHTNPSGTGDGFLHEVEVIGYNAHVGGVNTIGTETLTPTVTGATSPAALANARVVQLTLSGPVTPERADISEFRVLDTVATNVALAGTGFHRNDNEIAGFGKLPNIDTAGQSPLLKDNDTTTFSDSLGGIGDFYGITLAANTTLSAIEIVNRAGCCGGHGNMKLQVFSDTARSNLIYEQQVLFTNVAGATSLVPFQAGGTAVAALQDGREYRLELNATLNTSDTLSVNPIQSASTELVVDGDLIVTLLSGTLEVGDMFQLLDADAFSGAFDSITLPTLGSNRFWDLSNLLVDGTLVVGSVPEPASFALLGMGLVLFVVRRRPAR